MSLRLVDLHNDAITCCSAKGFLKYITGAQKAGVKTVMVSVWTTRMTDPFSQIRLYRQLIDGINARGGIKLLLHIEDAWFVNEKNIDELIEFKPFSVGLVWNDNNNLAGGANASGGLTPFGRIIIEKLVSNGIQIDLAHLNKTSFFDAAELLRESRQKLLCTHTCFDEINPHPRNIDRRQIQTIIDSGGLVGLTLVGDFLGLNKRARMHDVYLHIKYFLENFGEENLAIGTDFFGTANLPHGFKTYKNFKRFKKFLLSKGLRDTTIDKIFYLNAKKILNS